MLDFWLVLWCIGVSSTVVLSSGWLELLAWLWVFSLAGVSCTMTLVLFFGFASAVGGGVSLCLWCALRHLMSLS